MNGVEGRFTLGEVEVPDETPVTRATFGRPQIGLGQEVSGANEREAVVNSGEEKTEIDGGGGRGPGSGPDGGRRERQSLRASGWFGEGLGKAISKHTSSLPFVQK